jgi:23S rRNA (cytosine1962-C5)-methyltransferase
MAVDSNANSIERAKESGDIAGVNARINFRAENMFDYLRKTQEAKEKFDLIILDPPSFSRSRKAVSEARRGYKEIHLRAFKILQPGGVLATFCCSHHVSAAMFLQYIMEAAQDARVLLRREAVLGAGPDHPVIPSIPETEYLKGFVFTVMPE